MIKTFLVLIFSITLTACATGRAPNQAEVTRISPEELKKLTPPAVATITLDELITDSKLGKTPDEIIAKIKASQSRYELTPAQAVALNQQGLDVKVLDYIQQSNELAKQNAIADEMNKRAVQNATNEKKLKRERDVARMYNYDPFWGAGYGAFYGRPWIGPIGPAGRLWRGNRFGWGMGFGGYPFGW